MRICILGGGLAGSMLAWRLAQRNDVEGIDLLVGEEAASDATSFSGGVVRAYEPHSMQRRLATESLAELRASSVLRRWSQYQDAGSIYIRSATPGLAADLRELEATLGDTVNLASSAEVAGLGWADVEADTVAVVETSAGYLSPSALRAALLSDLNRRRSGTVSFVAAERIALDADGTVAVGSGNRKHHYDRAVVAAGAWSPSLLVRNGFGSCGLRTKSIQYTIYTVRGLRPPPFVDEPTGLYGRPVSGGGLLIGLATQEWDVAPGYRPPTVALHREAARIVTSRLPRLALVSAQASINATDCYVDQPVLSLRPVPGGAGAIWTFTGGSGCSVKTALAASREAAQRLVDASPRTHIRCLVPEGA